MFPDIQVSLPHFHNHLYPSNYLRYPTEPQNLQNVRRAIEDAGPYGNCNDTRFRLCGAIKNPRPLNAKVFPPLCNPIATLLKHWYSPTSYSSFASVKPYTLSYRIQNLQHVRRAIGDAGPYGNCNYNDTLLPFGGVFLFFHLTPSS